MNKKIALKLRLERFIKEQLWIYLIVLSTVAFCAWLFDRWIEGLMLIISHTCIRNAFDKQFHFNKVAYCLILTLSIIWFAMPISSPLASSLLSSIPISFLISFFGFVAQDRVDLIIQIKETDKYCTNLIMQLARQDTKDIYAMTEDELYEHCRSRGLSEEECRIAHFVVVERLQGKELYQAISYSERHTKRKRKDILDKIK